MFVVVVRGGGGEIGGVIIQEVDVEVDVTVVGETIGVVEVEVVDVVEVFDVVEVVEALGGGGGRPEHEIGPSSTHGIIEL